MSDESLAPNNAVPTSRRELLRAAGLAGATALVAAWSGRAAFAADPAAAAAVADGPTDGASQFASVPGRNINEKVLNFALTLEILEADLYRQAVNIAAGQPKDAPLSSNPGSYRRKASTGGLSTKLADVGFLYLVQFAYIEAAHRDFLRNAIQSGGGTPVVRNPGGYKFPQAPQPTIKDLLTKILPLEETGVRAYLGALPYLTDLGLATVAGGIFSTEARHSAAVATNLGLDAGPRQLPGDQKVTPEYPSPNTFEYFLKPKTVLTAATAFFA
ncbi:MAG TPA: ferritin-like domain-containing protein [Humisphaera sp.]